MTRLPLARPTIGDVEVEAQTRALRSGRLVLGPENAAFEDGLRGLTGAAHAVAMASGTAALHAALWALELPPGEIIVPSFTFPAPANVAAALGHTVVAVDVDRATWNIDPARAAAAVGPKTRAIVAVDQFGLVADLAALRKVAADAGLPLVEDAACALGATGADGTRAGTGGVIGCFSFHPRKVITTGEGGACVTNDARLAERLRLLRHHGIAAPGEFPIVGLNFRMPETCAAIGRAQLDRLAGLHAARERIAGWYRAALSLPSQLVPSGARHAWQTFAVLLPEGVDRARVIARLAEKEIEAGPATFAVHRIRSFRGVTGGPWPVSDALHDRALALPLYAELGETDVARVAAALTEALR